MRLYQIFDKVSNEVIGSIMSYKIDAPAVRMFYDWLQNPKVGPGAHAADYDLLCIGEQEPSGFVVGNLGQYPETVAIGAAWLAAQSQQLSLVKEGE